MNLARCKSLLSSPAFFAAPSFRVGTTERGSITVRLHEREFPHRSDYWDGNWVWTSVMMPPSIANAPALGTLRTDEIASFRDDLVALAMRKRKIATLESIDRFMSVEIDASRDEAWKTTCRVYEEDRRKHFEMRLQLDRRALPVLRRQLDIICRAFPIVGSPRAA